MVTAINQRAAATAVRAKAPAHQEDTLHYAMPIVTSTNITNIKNLTPAALPSSGESIVGPVNNLIDKADTYSGWFPVLGAIGGCIIGGASLAALGPEAIVFGCGTGASAGYDIGDHVANGIDYYEGAKTNWNDLH